MIRLLAALVFGVVALPVAMTAARAQEQDPPLIAATKQETWTLGEQQWDFKDVAAAYVPVKGTYNAKTGVAEWTLEIVKELAAGEVGTHESVEGSPFKPVLLDGEKIALTGEPEVKFATKLTGKPGDKVKIAVQLPQAEVLATARHIRIEKRTRIGF